MKDEYSEKTRSAIYQCERTLVFNAWEIGRHLSSLSAKGYEIKKFIEGGKHSFSYKRGMAFKRFYEETREKKILGTEIVEQLGVDKTLDIIQPLKSDSKDFLIEFPIEDLKEMSGREVREAVEEYRRPIGPSKEERFLIDAEEQLGDVVYLFEGIDTNKRSFYRQWDGRERTLKLQARLAKVI